MSTHVEVVVVKKDKKSRLFYGRFLSQGPKNEPILEENETYEVIELQNKKISDVFYHFK